eukprot:CAMPEP_0114255896 /NCGR_PEP_ID=MMETSP0058-20121206/17838_1 /TAXON_ID=36894 /ORGANISM="Pyramimonas parkeae, CCMP726" /LENGTH=262 /DNA_ID=CAMNT_0001370375 /DNA_START=186 /DNA_END=972 /DNA_ORIENTATION=+
MARDEPRTNDHRRSKDQQHDPMYSNPIRLCCLVGVLLRDHRLLFDGMDNGFDVDMAVNCPDIRSFDDSITRISFGFGSVDEYYQACSSANKIGNVAIPLLCIQAEDDPISVNDAVPHEEIKSNPNCLLVTTPTGGHLGWTAGENGPFQEPWTDKGVLEYFNATVKLVGAKGTGESVITPLTVRQQIVRPILEDQHVGINSSLSSESENPFEASFNARGASYFTLRKQNGRWSFEMSVNFQVIRMAFESVLELLSLVTVVFEV